VITAERFAKGMTFDQYLEYTGSAENLAREAFGGTYLPDSGSTAGPRKDNSAIFRERHARARLTDQQAAAIRWLVAQPNGPAKVLVISEDWSSDCRRDLPYLARLAEAGDLELRIFNRDGEKILAARRPDPVMYPDANHDLALQFLKKDERGEWAAVPVAVVFTKDFQELHRYIEFPAIYLKDRVRTHMNTPRAGESADQARKRSAAEFLALQSSPFFDIWASAGIDEILTGLRDRVTGVPRG
jgi:thioredoxin family protein